jgi:predicted restriction endonuclease
LAQSGAHGIDNGLLLGSDLHELFDTGCVTAALDPCVRISRRLRDDLDNGEYDRRFEGAEIWIPRAGEDPPDPAFLERRTDVVFGR